MTNFMEERVREKKRKLFSNLQYITLIEIIFLFILLNKTHLDAFRFF